VKKINKYQMLFFILLAGLAVFRLFYISTVNLCYDEAYNWDWSQQLALSYYSQPGMVAWWIRFFTWIGGNTEFGIRLSAVTASVISTVLLYFLTKGVTKSDKISFLTTMTLQFSPMGTLGSILIMHDVVNMPFWILSFFCLWKVVSTKNPPLTSPSPFLRLRSGQARGEDKGEGWWYLWGISYGLSMNSKLSSVLIVLCVIIFLLLSEKNRFYLLRKEFYFGLLLAFGLFIHNILWNIKQGFPTYKHIFGLGSTHQPELLKSTFEFFGSQFVSVSPVIFVLMIISLVYLLYQGIKYKNDGYLFIVSSSLSIFLFFGLLSFRSKVEPNWANIAYPIGIMSVYVYLEKVRWKKYIKSGLILFSFLFSIFVSAIILYPEIAVKYLGIRVSPENDRTNEVHGWDALGQRISELLSEHTEPLFISGPDYQLTAIIRFYTKGHPKSYCFVHTDRRHNQYDIWGGWDELKGKDGLFINYEKVDHYLMKALEGAFESVQLIEELEIYRKGYSDIPIRKIKIFYCKNFLGLEKTRKPDYY